MLQFLYLFYSRVAGSNQILMFCRLDFFQNVFFAAFVTVSSIDQYFKINSLSLIKVFGLQSKIYIERRLSFVTFFTTQDYQTFFPFSQYFYFYLNYVLQIVKITYNLFQNFLYSSQASKCYFSTGDMFLHNFCASAYSNNTKVLNKVHRLKYTTHARSFY